MRTEPWADLRPVSHVYMQISLQIDLVPLQKDGGARGAPIKLGERN